MVPNTAGPSTLRSLRFRPYGLSSMFLRAYVELHLPIAKVEEALLRTPAEWIPGLASSAEEHGDQLLAEVGFPVSALQLGKRVEIELGPAVRTPGRTWLPVSWRATGPGGLGRPKRRSKTARGFGSGAIGVMGSFQEMAYW